MSAIPEAATALPLASCAFNVSLLTSATPVIWPWASNLNFLRAAVVCAVTELVWPKVYTAGSPEDVISNPLPILRVLEVAGLNTKSAVPSKVN